MSDVESDHFALLKREGVTAARLRGRSIRDRIRRFPCGYTIVRKGLEADPRMTGVVTCCGIEWGDRGDLNPRPPGPQFRLRFCAELS